MTIADRLRRIGEAWASIRYAMAVDLGDADLVAAMIERAVSLFGRLDILDNNAAATHLASTRDLNVDAMALQLWEQSLRINLSGAMLATTFALPQIISAGESCNVNTSSGAGNSSRTGSSAWRVV